MATKERDVLSTPSTRLRNTERPFGPYNANRDNHPSSPQKPVQVFEDVEKRPGMHKKTKSSVSLKSFIVGDKSKPAKPAPQESDEAAKLKRPKSSTGLSALIPRSPRKLKSEAKSPVKEKENQTPPQTADTTPPPIWAQFATQQLQQAQLGTRVPLNDRIDVAMETSLYTPKDHCPSKQSDLYECRPTLTHKTDSRPRPRSEHNVTSPTRNLVTGTLSGVRKHLVSTTSSPCLQHAPVLKERASENCPPPIMKGEMASKPLPSIGTGHAQTVGDQAASSDIRAKRGSRVMAAVAAFNGTPNEVYKSPTKQGVVEIMDVKAIEKEFESLLETRNIPHPVRDKMRTLNTNIKIDFIRKEQSTTGSVSSTDSRTSEKQRDASRKRPMADENALANKDPSQAEDDTGDKTDNEGSPKKRARSRPRSRTFTFSRGDSSPKKEKSERPKSRGRSKSRTRGEAVSDHGDTEQTPEGRCRSLSFGRTPKQTVPQDFLSYLRKTPKPQDVEVGRLQKLRQLLRNETVGWVDAFISQGGMTEVIGLLERILQVEWRSVSVLLIFTVRSLTPALGKNMKTHFSMRHSSA
ncbi:MAG: hypothetical protein Q9174_002831 [Haloplaca sp. 1 TL-2023]